MVARIKSTVTDTGLSTEPALNGKKYQAGGAGSESHSRYVRKGMEEAAK